MDDIEHSSPKYLQYNLVLIVSKIFSYPQIQTEILRMCLHAGRFAQKLQYLQSEGEIQYDLDILGRSLVVVGDFVCALLQ
jgi:hypothetical protein